MDELIKYFDKIDFDKVNVIMNEDFAKIQISEDMAHIFALIIQYKETSDKPVRKSLF